MLDMEIERPLFLRKSKRARKNLQFGGRPSALSESLSKTMFSSMPVVLVLAPGAAVKYCIAHKHKCSCVDSVVKRVRRRKHVKVLIGTVKVKRRAEREISTLLSLSVKLMVDKGVGGVGVFSVKESFWISLLKTSVVWLRVAFVLFMMGMSRFLMTSSSLVDIS